MLLEIILKCFFLKMTSRFSESSCERWCFAVVSPSHLAHVECSRHPSQGWTCSRHHDVRENQLLALCASFLPQVPPFDRDFSGRVFSSSFTGSPVRSEEQSSPCDLPTISWVTGCTVRSSMGLGNWVGLEEPGWSASPNDCWPSFPTGWCSTVEPWSFPLVQLRSCVKEIIGGGRRDLPFIQCFSVFQSFSSHNATCWKYTLIDDCVRSCLIKH